MLAIVAVPGNFDPMTMTPTKSTLMPPMFPPPNPATFPTPQIAVPITPAPATKPWNTCASSPGIPTVSPITAPTTNPLANPSASPAVQGQTWCVAVAGMKENALQAALDYACGIGGADCSHIQMEASCYDLNTIQSHATYAFNIYYQRNPVATCCDFRRTATIVATDPSKYNVTHICSM